MGTVGESYVLISYEKQIALMGYSCIKSTKTVSIVLLIALQNFARCWINTLCSLTEDIFFFLICTLKKKNKIEASFL